MADAPKIIDLCARDEIDDGEMLKVETDDLELVVYHAEGDFYVTDDACTHGPGSLSEGELEGHVIECDFHNGSFDIRDGSVVAPPCVVELKTYRVVPDDARVLIELEG